MRAAWWAIGLCVVASGCGLVGRATHNLTYETRCCLDRAHEAKRNRRWVAEAWAHACADGGPRSGDYAQGFADGFLDYLEAGGSGEPPVLPPRRYWGSAYQTPVGRQLVDEWFAGFRHGAAVARDAGYRDLVTLPTSFGRPTTAALAPPEPDLLPPAAAQSQPASGDDERAQFLPEREEAAGPAPGPAEPEEEDPVEPPPRPVLRPLWGYADVHLPGGFIIKWPARFVPVGP